MRGKERDREEDLRMWRKRRVYNDQCLVHGVGQSNALRRGVCVQSVLSSLATDDFNFLLRALIYS